MTGCRASVCGARTGCRAAVWRRGRRSGVRSCGSRHSAVRGLLRSAPLPGARGSPCPSLGGQRAAPIFTIPTVVGYSSGLLGGTALGAHAADQRRVQRHADEVLHELCSAHVQFSIGANALDATSPALAQQRKTNPETGLDLDPKKNTHGRRPRGNMRRKALLATGRGQEEYEDKAAGARPSGWMTGGAETLQNRVWPGSIRWPHGAMRRADTAAEPSWDRLRHLTSRITSCPCGSTAGDTTHWMWFCSNSSLSPALQTASSPPPWDASGPGQKCVHPQRVDT